METKKIEIEVPEGKTAKCIDGMLKLVDDEPKDTRPVTERIKTFEDACKELGAKNPLIITYKEFVGSVETDHTDADLIAYMKLRIICAALNEGWEPQFTDDELRYYPWFWIYNKHEVDDMDEDERNKLFLFGGTENNGASLGFAYASTDDTASNASACIGSRLCLKNRELSNYCGKQFIDIWADYYLIKK